MNRRTFIQATTIQAAGIILSGSSLNAYPMSNRSSANSGRDNIIAKRGVIPAALTPFDSNINISLKDFRRHIEVLSQTEGVTAILVNGGAGEILSLTREERRLLVAEAVSSVNGKTPIIAALDETGGTALKNLAKDAQAEGAQAVLVMPPRDDMSAQWGGAFARYSEVFSATSLPVVIFQTGYSTETLARLAENQQVVGIKAACRTPFDFEENLRSIKELDNNIAVWTTHTDRFLLDLALGADGIISGTGSFAAGLHVELVNAMGRYDLVATQKVCERLFYINKALRYSCVEHDNFSYAVMKYALMKMGHIENTHVRPPNTPFTAIDQKKVIDDALRKAGLIV